MNTDIYRFQVGAFDSTIVNDGTFAYPYPAQVHFAGVPRDRLVQALQPYNIDPVTWTEYVSPYPSLLLNTGTHLVLVDTGAGNYVSTTGRLISNLHELGIAPEDIDTVILTHGHPDHIGGNLDSEGKPMFRNARYVMSRTEWAFWAADPDLSSLQIDARVVMAIRECARAKLPPIQDQLELVEDGDEIVPGLQAVSAPGHTPGHLALLIQSQDEQLLWGVDSVPHPVHVEQPDWISLVDYWPDVAVVTRRKLLGQAAVERALVHMFHFPFPGLGHVVLQSSGWYWQPLVKD